MNITVRKAEKKDASRLVALLETIAELHHNGRPDMYAGGGAKYSVQDMEKKISNKDEIILVAVNDDDYIMGYTMSKIFNKETNGVALGYKSLYIDDVCVDSAFRKNGVGHILMEKTTEQAKAEMCYNVELNVWAFNDTAIKFYESCGMKKQRQYMEIILDK